MARHLVLGNGAMVVTFDAGLNMRDLYYPYVGLWNHIGGQKNRMGVWADGVFSWVEEAGWTRRIGYRDDALVSSALAVNDGLGLALEVSDAVHHHENVYIRRVTVRNLAPEGREVRLFFTQDFSIDEVNVGDTAVYDPAGHFIYHYKRNRYFVANGWSRQGGIFQFATGIKRFQGAEGTWRDAEDGRLEGNPIAQGSVDSVISFRLFLGPRSEGDVWYWIAAGLSYREAVRLNGFVLERTPAALLLQTEAYWRHWLDRADTGPELPDHIARLYRLSLLMLRAHLDRGGAVIASLDSDILGVHRDHYGYMWPRDGAMAATALIRAGYPEAAEDFFAFCQEALTKDGFLLHKYNPDGSLGSSWHPWFHEGRRQLPIQEDETASVLFALWEYYRRSRNIEVVLALNQGLVEPAADFLCEYVYPHLGLPRESYDLWEERRGVFTYTAAAVCAGLQAAANVAALLRDETRAARYREAADRIRHGIAEHLYDPGLGRFLRGIYIGSDGSLRKDATLESSLYGLVEFGVLPPGDPRVVSTMGAIAAGLQVPPPVRGVARYEGDGYFRRSPEHDGLPGNPWFITTLWLGRWFMGTARDEADLDHALSYLEWAAAHALPSGLMGEQLDARSGEPVSVAPLTWSHAAFILAVHDYLDACRRLASS